MQQQKEQCFDSQTFSRFLDERTGEQEEAKIVTHISKCEKCRKILEELAGHGNVWEEIQNHLATNEAISNDTEPDEEVRDQRRDLEKVRNMLAPTDDPRMLGRLGNYEISGVIGRGSAGIVVKALDTRLNRYVAIKLLAPAYSNNGCARRRFEREGRAIASVKDPHVVPIHSVDEFQGTPYIVMQYLPDGSLDQKIRKTGPLSPNDIASIGMHVAKGLAAAHNEGIVHRDVKPANVLLENGVNGAMVTDFGLARVVDEATMTRSGSISGTPQFMSPEQAKGERVDPRSDLFSLGSVMYTACTGHAPFKSESVFGVIKKVCEAEAKPIRDSNPDIPEWLVAFIDRLHAKEPENRFQSANQVADLLARELAHAKSPTMVTKPTREWWTKPKASRSTRIGWRAGAIAVALAAAFTAGIFAFDLFDFGSGAGSPPVSIASASASLPLMGEAYLAMLEEENKKLPRFERVHEESIDVENGGQLLFNSNLGSIDVAIHEKPTVEMKLVHTVAAFDQEVADKLFDALKLSTDFDAKEANGLKLKKGRDAVLIANFPVKKLTNEEIQQADDLEKLKDELLIRNNSHYRNAKIQLLIPKSYSVNLKSGSGAIVTPDIDGFAKLESHGGRIIAGNITGLFAATSHGGRINAKDIGGTATVVSHGGHVELGNVGGDSNLESHGGHVEAMHVDGSVKAVSHGGNIQFGHVTGKVKAETHGGGITIWMAESAVDVMSHAGKVRVNFVGQPEGESVLKTTAGSVEVGYVDDISFEIDAKANMGRVRGPFVTSKLQKLKHQLNGGSAKLVCHADVGSVRFFEVNKDEVESEMKAQTTEKRVWADGQRAFDLAYEIHMSGKIDEAIDAHKEAAKYASHRGIATYNLGCAWSLKGEKDKAFKALNAAIDFGFDDIEQYETDGDLDSLRNDDRFKKLMERLDEEEDDEDDNSDVSFISTSGLRGTFSSLAKSADLSFAASKSTRKKTSCESCKDGNQR
jgi:serine/threonine protein kinase